MKKITFLFLFFTAIGFSQTKGISYQALILDPIEQQLPGFNNDKAPLANKNICLQFSIIDENTDDEYVETHIITTDEFGMVNLTIGLGTITGGYATTFEDIVWSTLPKNLKVAISMNGSCTYFTEISNAPFTAVPFALFAVNTQNTPIVLNNKAEIDLLKALLKATQISAGINLDGSYTANTTANYINTATSLKDADIALDTQVKVNEVAIAGNALDILTNTTAITTKVAITAIVDDLTTGGISVPLSAEQGKELKKLIDTTVNITVEDNLTTASTTSALSANQGVVLKGFVRTNIADITSNTNAIIIETTRATGIEGNIQTELDATQTGAGLNADGTYAANGSANYISGATALNDADNKLDAQAKVNATSIATETTRATGVEGNIQTELDVTQTGAGLNADGTYAANGSANYISGATALNDADNKLDAQVKVNVNNIATKLDVAGGTMTGAIDMGNQNISNATNIAAAIFSGDLNGTINTATTATTQTASNNSTKIATTAYVDSKIISGTGTLGGLQNTVVITVTTDLLFDSDKDIVIVTPTNKLLNVDNTTSGFFAEINNNTKTFTLYTYKFSNGALINVPSDFTFQYLIIRK